MQIISEHSPLYAGTERNTRCSGSKGRAALPATTTAPAPDFLRHPFLPVCATAKRLPSEEDTTTSYFKSLEKFCTLHQIEPLKGTDKPYPYNLLLSHWDAQKKMGKVNEGMSLQIISDNGKIALSSTDSIDADHKLFYVPVEPLYGLAKSKGTEDRKAANVLYAVFAYLYHNVGLPYYRSEESYQYWHYEMIENWILESGYDEDAEEINEHIEELAAAKIYGDVIERKIYSPDHFRYFDKRLQSLQPATDWQKRCATISKAFYELMICFPDASVYNHLQKGTNPYFDDIEDDDRIAPHQYLGFVAATKGWLGETLFEMISNELNECVAVDVPAVTHVYDEQLIGLDNNIDFERRLFYLIGELSILLNDLP